MTPSEKKESTQERLLARRGPSTRPRPEPPHQRGAAAATTFAPFVDDDASRPPRASYGYDPSRRTPLRESRHLRMPVLYWPACFSLFRLPSPAKIRAFIRLPRQTAACPPCLSRRSVINLCYSIPVIGLGWWVWWGGISALARLLSGRPSTRPTAGCAHARSSAASTFIR